ncbi:sucrase [Terriglobus albidus]|uniref:Sucrase n=1 Tax=Terriglobus albidus TaxID=1592106 RepID=A0A5B9EII4_9BACT|nr:glycoside hydrolase family protein [Terriglobus albidus]QEE30221.1 sucrase [Terriglobus albidus]
MKTWKWGSRFLIAVCLPLFAVFSGQAGAQASKERTASVPPLDFLHIMQPIPASAAFHDPGYFVWCGALIKGGDGKYHLFYSRWKVIDGFESWVTRSEVAHAIGSSPEGPFVFHDLALPARGKEFWDGMVTHNPTIHRFGRKYYLYYMGNRGNGVVMSTLNWDHRNNQRIGVAVADNPNGPWKRLDTPLIDVSADANAPDALCVSNPSITQGSDGRFRLLYKAVGKQKPLPGGGPVVHLMATSDSPTGPFRKNLTPMFTFQNLAFPFEDPYLWFDAKRDTYFVIMKEMAGIISGTGHFSLVLFQSHDTVTWEKAEHPLVSTLELHWKEMPLQAVRRLERPQLMFDATGKPIVLLVAIDDGSAETYNVRIPLSEENPKERNL